MKTQQTIQDLMPIGAVIFPGDPAEAKWNSTFTAAVNAGHTTEEAGAIASDDARMVRESTAPRSIHSN